MNMNEKLLFNYLYILFTEIISHRNDTFPQKSNIPLCYILTYFVSLKVAYTVSNKEVDGGWTESINRHSKIHIYMYIKCICVVVTL